MQMMMDGIESDTIKPEEIQMMNDSNYIFSAVNFGFLMNKKQFQDCPFNWTEAEAMINCTEEDIVSNSKITLNCCTTLNPIFSQVAGYVCIIVALFGLSGNLLTLLAIPWATRYKLFGFHTYPGKYTNLFIVNLAFADFIYCLIQLPMYSLQYIQMSWPLGHNTCRLLAASKYVNAFAAWLSVGFVALSRCLSLQKNSLARKFLYGTRGHLVVLSIWVYAALLVSPSFFNIYGQFGYNRKMGKCDFLELNGNDPHVLFYTVGFLVPLCILLVSYAIIWRMSRESSKFLKTLTAENKIQLDSRDHRLTIMILLVCGCYVIFVGPIALINVLDYNAEKPEIHLVFFLLYWLQYSFNFVVYALRNEQYRKAYKFFLSHVWKTCCRPRNTVPHNTIFVLNCQNHVLQADLQGDNVGGTSLVLNEIMDICVSYSGKLKLDKSYKETVEVEAGPSSTIIILPGNLESSSFKTKEKQRQKISSRVVRRTRRSSGNSSLFRSEWIYNLDKEENGRKLSYSLS